jgi:hypothetical protein
MWNVSVRYIHYIATPSGLKSWRFNYSFKGKYLTLTFGNYPLVTLKEAREKFFEAKLTLSNFGRVETRGVVDTAQRTTSSDGSQKSVMKPCSKPT